MGTSQARATATVATMGEDRPAEEGFAAVYREHFGFVWLGLRRLGVPSGSLEDAVQDVFVVVHRRMAGGDPRRLRPWIGGIVRRIASRYHRTQRRTERRHDALARVVPACFDADEALARRQAVELLQTFLDDLDAKKREAFVLGELESLPRDALGEALGISPNTAYSRLRAARVAFSHRFADAGDRVVGYARAEEPPRERAHAAWLVLLPRLEDPSTPVPVLEGPGAFVWTKVAAASATVAVAGVVAWAALSGSDPPQRAPAVVTAAATPLAAPIPPPRPQMSPAPPMVPSGAAVVDAEVAAPPPAITRSKPISREPSSVLGEVELLERARRALGDDAPTEALASLDAHARRYPTGRLAREREATRVLALCAAGRRAESHAAAEAFLRAHPGHSMAAKVAVACR